ncbi:MAG: hypothetical protein AB8G11_07860 [Saprospiraceae bacterium]
METVNAHQRFINKKSCPYCEGDLISSANSWIQKDNGNYEAMDIDVECCKEPDISNRKEWQNWYNDHNRFLDAWENWHPIQDAILKSINEKYQFNKDDF